MQYEGGNLRFKSMKGFVLFWENMNKRIICVVFLPFYFSSVLFAPIGRVNLVCYLLLSSKLIASIVLFLHNPMQKDMKRACGPAVLLFVIII